VPEVGLEWDLHAVVLVSGRVEPRVVPLVEEPILSPWKGEREALTVGVARLGKTLHVVGVPHLVDILKSY
jgi:hypothetical protein